jgi:hypothetical protein
LDSIVDSEFAGIFDRTTQYVSLKGCLTAKQIDKRMLRYHQRLFLAKREAKTARLRKRLAFVCSRVKILRHAPYDKGTMTFGERIVFEASRNPKSIYNLTLLYGRNRAREIRLSMHRASMRIRREKEKEQIHHVHPR